MVVDMGALSELSANIKPFSPMFEGEKMDTNPDTFTSAQTDNFGLMELLISSKSPKIPTSNSRQVSPAPSTMSSLSSVGCSTPKAVETLVLGAPPAKRRKYTAEEKEQQRLDKEEKQRKRAEEKAKKDEERLVKDEERRQKNEVKEQKKLEKELEKQQKDDEKRKKEEEKLKKENSQKRINSFFVKPTTPSKVTGNNLNLAQSEDQQLEEEPCPSPATTNKSPEKLQSDYLTYFLPFSLPSNSVLAPHNQFTWDANAITHFERKLAKSFQATSGQIDHPSQMPFQLVDVLDLPGFPRRGSVQPTVTEIMRHIHGPDSDHIDLTNAASFWDKPMEVLKRIPVRRICFYEDIRPPYVGTYTKLETQTEAQSLWRNPFKRLRPDTNYDYDSEAEWEDPGEGEDLNSEGESETESNDGAEDMEGFLDDEEDSTVQGQRKRPIGDLEPICTGLCWEGIRGQDSCGMANPAVNLRCFGLETLEGNIPMPIDPFSTSYWSEAPTESSLEPLKTKLGPMDPPQHPFQARITGGLAAGTAPRGRPPKSSSLEMNNSGAGKILEGAELEDFKKAVQGSDLTKVGIIEVLKKRFPKTSKGCLKDTLNSVAIRIGVKDVDKRWVIVDTENSRPTQLKLQL